MPTLAVNRQARRSYEVLERFEAGIELTGAEVKSIKASRISLRESYVRIKGGEAFLTNTYVAPYQPQATNPDPRRPRRLLLKKNEIDRLKGRLAGKNLTIVPLRVYTRRYKLIKLEIALVRGKRRYEKRAQLKKRETEREIQRALKNR